MNKPLIIKYYLNEFQRAVLTDYSDGDFSWIIAALDGGSVVDFNSLGDGLLTFLLVELSNSESCETVADAESRLETIHDEIEVCLDAIQKLADAIQNKVA